MIELRLITTKDLEWARRIRNNNRQYFFDQEIITKKKMDKWFLEHTSKFFIIWVDKKRIGTISVNTKELGNVLILPEYRKKGIFTKVMQIVKSNYYVLYLHVKSDNLEAIKAYKKVGFVPTAVEMRYDSNI